MAMSMSRVGLLVLMLSSLGCQLDAGISNSGFCMHAKLIDLRIGEMYCLAGDTELGAVKEAASKQFMDATEEVLPGMVDAGVRAAMSCVTGGASEAVPALLQSCDIAEAVKPALERERKRRSEAEKEENRARREEGLR